LGLALKEKGYKLVGLVTSRADTASKAAEMLGTIHFDEPAALSRIADLVFITTPDRLIGKVTSQIASKKGFKPGQVVLHTSGSFSSSILSPAAYLGAKIASFHPLQTFPDVESGLKSLPGTYFVAEGDKEALLLAAQLAKDLQGNYLEIATEMKPLYHAAACVVCNYLVTLLDMGLNFLARAGLKKAGLEPVMPLIQATLKNVANKGVIASLTGPIVRGDAATVASHLKAIEEHLPHFKQLYCHLGRQTVLLADLKASLDDYSKKEITNILGGALNE